MRGAVSKLLVDLMQQIKAAYSHMSHPLRVIVKLIFFWAGVPTGGGGAFWDSMVRSSRATRMLLYVSSALKAVVDEKWVSHMPPVGERVATWEGSSRA